MIGSPEAANIRIPGEDTPEKEELSPRQLDSPREVEAGGAMSSQGLGGVEEDSPVDGNRLLVSLTELNETMKIMASVMKNIQDQQGKQKSTEEIQGAAMQSLDKMSKVVVEAMQLPA